MIPSSANTIAIQKLQFPGPYSNQNWFKIVFPTCPAKVAATRKPEDGKRGVVGFCSQVLLSMSNFVHVRPFQGWSQGRSSKFLCDWNCPRQASHSLDQADVQSWCCPWPRMCSSRQSCPHARPPADLLPEVLLMLVMHSPSPAHVYSFLSP